MEEERHRVRLLPLAAENRGVSAQRSPRKTGEGDMSVGVDGRWMATAARMARCA
jgi:hypothetical protein